MPVSAEFALGVVGLASLVSSVETCSKGYDRLVGSLLRASTEASRFALDFRIEERKFALYWEYMGRGDHFPLLRQQSAKTQRLIVDVTSEICALLSASRNLVDGYGSVEQVSVIGDAADIGALEAQSTPDPSPNEIQRPTVESKILNSLTVFQQTHAKSGTRSNAPSQPLPLPMKKRVAWAWKETGRAKGLLIEMQKYNNELWTSLAPHHELILNLGTPSFILPGISDMSMLQKLSTCSVDVAGESLVNCSRLRTAVMAARFDTDNNLPLSAKRIISHTSITGTRSIHGNENLHLGILDGVQVVIERKKIQSELENHVKEVIRNRLYLLANILSQEHHPSLRIMQCIGVSSDARDELSYGLVFRAFATPSSPNIVQYHTLASLLQNAAEPDVGDKFKLALALSVSIMHLHAAGWLHKSINPNVIIFRQVDREPPVIDEPKLLGFDLSRPARAHESLEHRKEGIQDLYLHPDRHRDHVPRYQARYDFFSLGMCLLIVAIWKPIAMLEQSFHSRFPDTSLRTPDNWAKFCHDFSAQQLGRICGRVYRDAVLLCLKGDFRSEALVPSENSQSNINADWSVQIEFYNRVVRQLAECSA